MNSDQHQVGVGPEAGPHRRVPVPDAAPGAAPRGPGRGEAQERAWVASGPVAGRGPDNEPLINPGEPVALIADAVLDEADAPIKATERRRRRTREENRPKKEH